MTFFVVKKWVTETMGTEKMSDWNNELCIGVLNADFCKWSIINATRHSTEWGLGEVRDCVFH
jgi:hypothetical protein